uniref:heavy metal-binding domain-containing protein n=1 Tax=Sulfonitrofixus jiaomeiensis TaxID=3131938 RepID=UPI003F6063D5
MHPEVRQKSPGSCPKCGIALEKAVENFESVQMQYICPMHPEVVSDRPGNCPKCGMGFEPMIAATAMSFSSVSVIINALCLKKTKL